MFKIKNIKKFLLKYDPGFVEVADMIKDMREVKPKASIKLLTKFIAAIRADDVTTMHHILDLTVLDVNVCDKWQTTPLMIAVKENKRSAIEILLEHKADPNLKNRYGMSSLAIACHDGNFKIAQMLLKVPNIDIHVVDKTCYTPLLWAVNSGNPSLVALLLEKGARLDVCDDEGFCALHIAVGRGYDRVTEQLLEAGANIHISTPGGHGIITFAVANKQDHLVPLLLEFGAKDTRSRSSSLANSPVKARANPSSNPSPSKSSPIKRNLTIQPVNEERDKKVSLTGISPSKVYRQPSIVKEHCESSPTSVTIDYESYSDKAIVTSMTIVCDSPSKRKRNGKADWNINDDLLGCVSPSKKSLVMKVINV